MSYPVPVTGLVIPAFLLNWVNSSSKEFAPVGANSFFKEETHTLSNTLPYTDANYCSFEESTTLFK